MRHWSAWCAGTPSADSSTISSSIDARIRLRESTTATDIWARGVGLVRLVARGRGGRDEGGAGAAAGSRAERRPRPGVECCNSAHQAVSGQPVCRNRRDQTAALTAEEHSRRREGGPQAASAADSLWRASPAAPACGRAPRPGTACAQTHGCWWKFVSAACSVGTSCSAAYDACSPRGFDVWACASRTSAHAPRSIPNTAPRRECRSSTQLAHPRLNPAAALSLPDVRCTRPWQVVFPALIRAVAAPLSAM